MTLSIRGRGKPKRNHCAEQRPGGSVELTLDEKRPKVRVAGPAQRGRGFVMFIALLGYIGTMVAAFAMLVVVWHHVIGPPQLETVRQQPRPIGAVTQAAPPVQQPGPWGPAVVHKADEGADVAASVEDARLAAAQAAAAEKAKRLKQARYQKRKEQERKEQEQLARQRDDRQYSTALGYNQEPTQEVAPAPVFSMFGPRRF
jgi:hypothetical protein